MPSINPTPSRPTTPTADTSRTVPLRDGPSSSSDTPTSHALTSIDNFPTMPGESIRVDVATNYAPTGGASSAAEAQAIRYSQALAEWESGGHNDELRGEAAERVRAYLASPNNNFICLANLGLRQAPPLPDAPLINLSGNQLTELPALPGRLECLVCRDNPLERFPHLPTGLRELDVDYVAMSSLPPLPDTLIQLSANNCGLDTPPVAWPPDLQRLHLRANNLTHVPALPSTLALCSLENNQLTELPENFAAMRSEYATIFIDRNPLSTEMRQFVEGLQADQAYRPRIEIDEPLESGPVPDSDFDDDDVGLTNGRQLADAVRKWYTPERWMAVQDQWEAFADEPQAGSFTAFMARLAQSVQATQTGLRNAFRATVTTWLDRLAQDDELRADTFRFADDAGTSCDDRAALSFLQMMRLRTVSDVIAGRHDATPAAILDMARSVMRQEALEGIAQQWVEAHPDHTEDIEVYLAFLTQRSEQLQLSLDLSEMRYMRFSGVSQAELDQAVETVQALDDTFPQFLSNWAPWRSVLQRWDPARHESALAQLYDNLEQESDRTNGLLGPGAVEALHHAAFGPMMEAYLAAKGLPPFEMWV